MGCCWMVCVKELIHKLCREHMPENVVKLRENREVEATRKRLLAAAVAHCEVQCGGCELTRRIAPP